MKRSEIQARQWQVETGGGRFGACLVLEFIKKAGASCKAIGRSAMYDTNTTGGRSSSPDATLDVALQLLLPRRGCSRSQLKNIYRRPSQLQLQVQVSEHAYTHQRSNPNSTAISGKKQMANPISIAASDGH